MKRLVSMFHRNRRDADLNAELESHLQLHIDDNLRAGMTPEEARRKALIQLGGLDQTKESYRDRRGIPWLDSLAQDTRFALRMLRKSPGFTAVAVLTLALGIGANTAIFSLIDQILLQDLPVRDPGQLVILRAPGAKPGHVSSDSDDATSFSYPEYKDIRDQSTVFSGLLARMGIAAAVSQRGESQMATGELVTGNYFDVLGVKPALGRVFTGADETAPGANPFAILSFGYWSAHFGNDPNVLNKVLTVNGTALTIVGVSQGGFTGVQVGRNTDIFVPITMKAFMTPGWDGLNARNDSWLEIIGRLNPGVTSSRAQTAVVPTFHAIEESALPALKLTPDSHRAQQYLDRRLELLDGQHGRPILQSNVQTPLLALLMLVGLILLIACANLASLLLARGEARQRELAVRIALGGRRWRLVKQLMTESLLLAIAGGLGGYFIASSTLHVLARTVTQQLGVSHLGAQLDIRVLLFTIVISVLTVILFGLGPALRITHGNLPLTLKTQGMAVSGGASTVQLRKWLMAAQVALTAMLLASAGFFLKSLTNLEHQNIGIKLDHVMQFSIRPSLSGYDVARTAALFDRIREAIRALPGVRSVTVAEYPILETDDWASGVTIEGYNARADEEIDVFRDSVSPGYFATMGIPLLAGRDFNESDSLTSPNVIVINEKMAEKYFAGRNPIGLHMAWDATINSSKRLHPDVEIVGVVQNSKYEDLRDSISPFVYQPYAQDTKLKQGTFYVRTTQEPSLMAQTFRATVHQLDPGLPLTSVRTLQEEAERSVFPDRALTFFSLLLGLLAALLAAIGLYGVLAYVVARRTREIGIRMAVGASRGNVAWLIFQEVIAMAGAGLAVGLAAAFALGFLIQSQLYGVKASDPIVYIATAALLSVIVALAAWLPARKATAIDPVTAIRSE